MKKILLLASLTFCLGFAANAQNDKTTTIANDQNQVNVSTTTAEPIITQAVESEPTGTTSAKCEKACCSSKNKKETANAGSKSCCSSGKKSSASCSDKKAQVSPGQQDKTELKSNAQ